MGVYLNPGSMQFQKLLNDRAAGGIFVDKTAMIQDLNALVNTTRGYIAVSRPRRFGKSTTANMICAYYDKTADSRSLFEGKKLSECNEWDKYLGKFNVLYLTMTDFTIGSKSIYDMLDYMEEEITSELMQSYSDIQYGSRINLLTVMNKIYSSAKRTPSIGSIVRYRMDG